MGMFRGKAFLRKKRDVVIFSFVQAKSQFRTVAQCAGVRVWVCTPTCPSTHTTAEGRNLMGELAHTYKISC